MAKPDIFFGEDETTVVEPLEIGVDREKSPDIQIKPDVANIHLGGGGGNESEGDVKLLDKDGNSRVQLTAGGGKVDDSNTVLIDGQTATITVGNVEGGTSRKGSIDLGGAEMDGNGNLTLGGHDISGDVELLRTDPEGAATYGGTMEAPAPAITLDADGATATVGGANADGIVKLQNGDGATTAEVRGDLGQVATGGKGTPGSILLKNEQANPVGFVKASGDDVVITTLGGGSGGNETVAMRIRPDGTVEFPQGGA